MGDRSAATSGDRPGWWWRRRGADDELDWLVGRRWKLDVRLLDDVYQPREALPCDLVEWLPHGGERGSDVGGDGDVVEPDDADVFGDPASGLELCADETDCHVVVRGEHRGHGAVAGQFPARGVAGRGRPVALDDRRFVRVVGL